MSSYTIPYVTTRSGNGERTVDIYSRLLADRIVYLGTGIDDGVANAVIAQLLHLENDNPDTPISLYINSAGGSIPATLAIYDAMQFVRPRRGDHLRRSGRRDGGSAAGRGCRRAAEASSRTAGSSSTPRRRKAAARSPTSSWRPMRSSA